MGRSSLLLRWIVSCALGGAVLVGCAQETRDFCGAVGDGLVPFDHPEAVSWWHELESNTTGPLLDDVRALRVVAEQVAALGADATADEVAARVLRPRVTGHVVAVADEVRAACEE